MQNLLHVQKVAWHCLNDLAQRADIREKRLISELISNYRKQPLGLQLHICYESFIESPCVLHYLQCLLDHPASISSVSSIFTEQAP